MENKLRPELQDIILALADSIDKLEDQPSVNERKLMVIMLSTLLNS